VHFFEYGAEIELLERKKPMFGHMRVQPILRVGRCSPEVAVETLMTATENALPIRWIELPAAILILVSVPNDPESGAFYVLDRNTGSWLWIDFEDEQYGGYTVSDFDLLVQEYDFISLVERPGLLRANPGWLLEPHKPAEMAAQPCK
jgi:hypothetical protein